MTAPASVRARSLRSRLSSGSLPILGLRVAAQAVGVVVVIASLLLHGAAATGVFVLTVTISQIAAMPVGTGFGRSLTREAARGNEAAVASTWISGLAVSVPLASAAAVVGLVVLDGLLPQAVTVVSVSGSTAGLALLQLEAAERRGRGRPIANMLIEAIAPQIAALAALCFAYAGVEAFVLARAGVLLCVGLAVAGPPRRSVLTSASRASWMSSANAAVIAGTQLLLVRSDLLLIGWLIGPEKVAFYAIMQRIAETVYWPVAAHLVGAAPRYAAPGDGDELQAVVFAERQSLRSAQILSVLVAAGGVVVAAAIGLVRPDMGLSLLFLVIAAVILVRYGPETSLLIMRDEVRRVAAIGGAGVAVNIVLAMVLLGVLGVAGAALATLLAVATMYTSLRRLARRRLGVTASA